MDTIALLLPDLALVALGVALYRTTQWGREFWQGLEKLTYYLLFPALLFGSIVRTRFEASEALPAVGIALAAVAGGIVLAWLARPVLRPVAVQFASGAQCAFRFNSYVLLALSQRIGGESGLALAAVIVGFSIPPINVAAVYPLARASGARFGGELVRNPLILATVAGLAANFADLQLPEIAGATLSRLGSASLALGLLAAGAGLRFEGPAGGDTASRASAARLTVWFTAVKFAAMPLLALGLARWVGLPPLATQVVVIYASMPTSSSAYILASRMGGDGAFTAFLISVSLLASLAALPFWLSIVS